MVVKLYLPDGSHAAELLERLLRTEGARLEVEEDPLLQAGPIRLDRRSGEAWVEGRRVHLNPKESRLLEVLLENAGRLVSHAELLRRVWGYCGEEDGHLIRTTVMRLRRKLGPAGNRIVAKRARGYMVC